MRRMIIGAAVGAAASAIGLGAPTPAHAQEFRARLQGFQEVPAAISTPNTSYSPTNSPAFDTPVYWRVRAKSANNVYSQWSEPFTYTITWDPEGERGPEDEDVTLGLVENGDGYLIEYEL